MEIPKVCDCCGGPLGKGTARVEDLVFCQGCIVTLAKPTKHMEVRLWR